MTFESLTQDVKYAIRGLRTKPGFAIAVITTIGLGIGANAAMFGIVDRLLFRPPALMKDPATAHRVYYYQTFRGKERANGGGQYARYADIARWTHSFSSAAGYAQRDLAVGVGEAAREMHIGVVSATFFGFGPDTFRTPFGSYQTAKFVRLFGPDQIANGPHNTFMNYLATEGFPGLLLFVGLLVMAGLRAIGTWRRLRHKELEGTLNDQQRGRESRLFLAGTVAALLAYLIQASFNVQQIGLSFCFWSLLGLLVVLSLDAGVPVTVRPGALVAAGNGVEDVSTAGPRSLGAAANRVE